jgi:hypothetical protein
MSFPKSSGQVQLMPEKQIIKQLNNTASPPLTHTIAVRPAYEQKILAHSTSFFFFYEFVPGSSVNFINCST